MTETAIRGGLGYYVWNGLGADPAVRFSTSVIVGLDLIFGEAVATRSLADGEMWGVLLGKAETGKQGRVEIVVEDYEALPFQLARGSAAELSEANEQWLQQLLQRREGLFAIGYYRSTCSGLTVTEQDRALIHAYFHAPEGVALLVHPQEDAPSLAQIFSWQNGSDLAASSYPLAPLSLCELMTDAPAGSGEESHLEWSAKQRIEPVRRPVMALEERKTRTSRPGTRGIVYAALALLLTGGLLFTYYEARLRSMREAPVVIAQSGSELGLKVERAGADLRLTWDRHAAATASVQGAILSVIDGNQRRDLQLQPDQFPKGNILYTPINDDVSFQVTAFLTTGGRVSESTRVLSHTPAPLPVESLLSRERVNAPRTIATKLGAPAAQTSAPPAPKPASLPPIVARVAPPEPLVAGVAEPPPSIAPQLTSALPKVETFLAQAPPPASKATAPPLPATVHQPANPERVEPTPAVAIKRVMPSIPPDINTTLHRMRPGETTIIVKVFVNAKGEVVKAEPAEQPEGSIVSGFLTRLSVDTARFWRFQPAMLHDRPVQSEAFIHFRFRRGSSEPAP